MWGFLPLSRKELEEANDCARRILCSREGESAKLTSQSFYNDYTADIRDDQGWTQLSTSYVSTFCDLAWQ